MFNNTLCKGSTLKHAKKAQRIVYNGLFSFFLFATSSQATPVPNHPILLTPPQVGGSHAFARQAPAIPLQKINAHSTIDLQDLSTNEAIDLAVSNTLAATQLMPENKKAILNLDLDFLQIAQSSVIVRDNEKPLLVDTNTGSLLPDQGIWLDQGIDIVKQRVTDFFQKYHDAGGELDVVSLNYSGLTLSAAAIKITGEQTGSLQNYLQAIEDDARFATIANTLGFSDLHAMYDGSTQATSKQKQWNAVMKDRIAVYLNNAFYQPIADIFPTTRLSAHNYYTKTTEKIVGTHQSRTLSTDTSDPHITINQQTYTLDRFNTFRRELDQLRHMALASNAAIHPEFLSKTQPENNILAQSDLYQEMVFHTGLLGVRDFLFNNNNGSSADNQLLNDTLVELDQQVGSIAYQSAIDAPIDWQQPYVLSAVEQGDQRIWRFTPNTTATDNAESSIVNYSPAQFLIDNKTLTFPNSDAQSLNNTTSNAGVWVTQNKQLTSTGCEQPKLGKSCTEYFANNDLTGSPTLFIETATSRREALAAGIEVFNQQWGLTGTGFATGNDNFSVRYRETQQFIGGNYAFTINADDAVKLWIDDTLIIDAWNKSDTTQEKRNLTTQITLASGEHTLIMEYADYADEATLSLSAKQLSCIPEIGQICLSLLEQDANLNQTDTHFIQSANGIKFNFDDFKFPANLSADDNLHLKWEGVFTFEEADYIFNITHGKGKLRFWIDEVIVYEADSNNTNELEQTLKHMSQGSHRIRVEQQAVQGAHLDINWEKSEATCATIPEGEFCTEFFAGINLAGLPIHKRTDPSINFYWRGDSPEAGIVPKDRFSARWQGTFNFEAGDYRFISSTDDGMRVWVDGEEIISSWKNQGTTEYFTDLTLSEGKHLVKVEYYENYGWATAKLKWEKKADCSGIPENQFCGSYFNQNKAFNGEPDRTYLSDSINLDLQRGDKPLHGMRNNRYSIRWLGKFDFAKAGNYQFNSDADDGLRIWIDEALVTDTWKRPWPFRGKDQRIVEVSKGQHIIKVEYQQAWGAAKASIDWQYLEECNAGIVKDAFCMEMYENRQLNKLKGLQQLPKYLKKVDNIDFDWKRGAPEKLIASNNFSIRWTGQHRFDKGNYRFKLSSDDGMRLFIDGERIIDQWRYRAETNNEAVVKLDAGYHDIKLEYFEGWGSAAAHLNWQKIPSCDDALAGQVCGEFFNSNNLSGVIADVQIADSINFDWGRKSPSPQIRNDRFSARWTSKNTFEEGLYRFYTDSDDGVRIFVDGKKVLDRWKRRWPMYGKSKILVPLASGQHTIQVEYKEDWGNAKAKVFWEKAPDCSIIPDNAFCTAIYGNRDLSGDAIDTRTDTRIDFDWGKESPTLGVWRDRFSTRSIGKFNFEQGYYNFNVAVDDGMKVWLDDKLIVDNWKRSWYLKGKENRVIKIAKGEHTIKVETVEHYGSANAKLNWSAIEACAATPENAFCMEIFDGRALDKNNTILPKYMAKVDNIDVDWNNSSPNELVWRDNFSVRWQGKHQFSTGNYRFSSLVDDGVRVWVDNKLIIDQWRYRGNKPSEKIITLSEGLHDVKMEYYEAGGRAAAKLTWKKLLSCDDVPNGQLCAEYFNNRNLEGSPVDVQYVDAINFDWGRNAPTSNVNRDKFSVRWTGSVNFTDGLYRFRTADVDDGMRILVDNENILDLWKRKWPWYGNQRVLKTMTAGKHKVVVEYREDWGNAKAKAFWEKAPDCDNDVPNGEFCASFYAGTQLEASKRIDTRIDKAINHEWGTGSPHPNVSRDKFSTRWAGNFDLAEGEYTFNVRTDDGFRLKVGEQTLIESWKGQAPTAYQKRLFLEKGTYKIVAEYYEQWGGATAQLNWTVAPSRPSNLVVISATPNSITLGWNAAKGNATKYEVWRDQKKIAEVIQTSYADTELASFQQYAYQIVAVDAAGNRSLLSDSLTTFTQDGTAPSAPTGLAAKNLSDGGIELTWQASSDNIGVTVYQVLRDQTIIGTANNTRYIDTTANENIPYKYHIIALDNANNTSAPSATITILAGDLTAPSAVNNLQATASESSVLLTWDKALDNTGVTRYRVIRDGRLIALSNLTSYTDNSAEKGITYGYTIKALDASGNVSLASNTVNAGVGALCTATTDYFTATVEPSLAICSSCHIAGGAAQNTRLVLAQGNDASSRNLSTLNSLTNTLGSTSILNKVSGQQAHGGGTVFVSDSTEYQQLSTLLTQLEAPQNCNTDTPTQDDSAISAVSLAANCSSCHGSEGASSGPATPTISGLESHYLLKVLRDYKDNSRASTVMNRIAKGYTDTQLQSIANYFAAQPHYVAEQSVNTALVAQGKILHDSSCASCHSNKGKDTTLTGTRLAGQWQVYTQRTLEDYIAGLSTAPQTMLDNLNTLHQQQGDQSIAALAAFYASIKADTEAPSTPDAVEVAATTLDSITLTWFDADDNWSVDYYEIYRDGVLIGTTEFSAFTDLGLTAGNYEYRIVAVDSAGNRSERSMIVNTTLSSDDMATKAANLLDYTATLRKAAIILLGRLPSESELSTATTEETFRATLRTMLDNEKSLHNFVYRAAHETFLSNGAANAGSNEGIRREDFPMLDNLSDAENRLVRDTIKKEPVYLLQYIVDADRPWTESLTADYTVLNGTLAKTLGAKPLSGDFNDPMDSNERLPARISTLSARLGDKTFPHAGVLTTNAWLSRFPTTDTNRNRHRAAQVYQQFFGIDIEALAERPIDDSANGNYLVPTMENPNCMVCHTIMEPVAGAFKNWGTRNRYSQNFNGERGDLDSLSRAYKSRNYALNHENQRWYHKGDTWYRDMFKAGFNDQEIPDSSNSLQWLGQSLVRDPRFAKGTVYFWYRALFKREPLIAPLDTQAVDYTQRIAAFNEQDAIFDQLASRLTQDRGNGVWNVKDLLIDMVNTPLFRADAKTDQVTAGSDLGLARLLTPEELNRKLKAVTGYDWRNFRDDRVWRDRMGLFYGGFDGGNVQPTPNTKMNSLMSKIPERMAVEMSCNMVNDEFNKGSDERNLLHFVEPLDTPAFEQVEIANNNLLLNPGAENDLTNWVVETGTARVLSGPRGCQGGPSIKSGEKIFNPGSICQNQTALGRLYQQVDVTPWATMIDAGGTQALFGAALRGWSRDNDEASVYLTFHATDGSEISRSQQLLGAWYEWKSIYDYIAIPAQTRRIRFHIQGRRISSHSNNDAFADDTYLRVILQGTQTQTLGEQHIRATLQFLHQRLLGETLATDSSEIDRSYQLFKAVWADTSTSSSDTNSCRLYREWEDPHHTKRAWSIVLMYLMTDAKFLHE